MCYRIQIIAEILGYVNDICRSICNIAVDRGGTDYEFLRVQLVIILKG